MSIMALTPETIDALSQALEAVLTEIGDDPAQAELAEALGAAQAVLPEGGAPVEPGLEPGLDEEPPLDEEPIEEELEPERDAEGDDFSFVQAEKRMGERRKKKAPAEEPQA